MGPASGAEVVNDHPHLKYSTEEIASAGKVLAGDLSAFGDEVPSHIRDAFLVANNWRDAHAYPMRSIHASVRHHIRKNDFDAITGARLKRMQAIRRKLRRISVKFHKLQDLGGCRVIVATIAEARSLIEILKSKLPSVVLKETDYISRPKVDGYRSHHIIFGFRQRKRTPYDDRRIELQVRTHLQHSWATTVEAVGLYRGEELKSQKGDKDWLRFFALVSAEFADAEKCTTVPDTPVATERGSEIRRLAKSLDALNVLEAVTKGFQGTDIPLARGYKPTHYLIRYDHSSKTVHVEPHNKANKATASYEQAEEVQRTGDENDVVVLVEVDKIKDLKKAYPNYFGDVDYFQRQLKQIVLGGAAVEYARPPKQHARKAPREASVDLSWLRGTRFPAPGGRMVQAKSKAKRSRKSSP